MTRKERQRVYNKRWYAKHWQERYQAKRKQILRNNKRWRDSEKGKVYAAKIAKLHAVKIKARKMLSHAVRSGKIKRLPCEVCGEKKTHGHHTDYSKPFKVKWLCVQHHVDIHQ